MYLCTISFYGNSNNTCLYWWLDWLVIISLIWNLAHSQLELDPVFRHCTSETLEGWDEPITHHLNLPISSIYKSMCLVGNSLKHPSLNFDHMTPLSFTLWGGLRVRSTLCQVHTVFCWFTKAGQVLSCGRFSPQVGNYLHLMTWVERVLIIVFHFVIFLYRTFS